MPVQSINPTTEEVLKMFEEEGWGAVEEKLTQAQEAFGSWKNLEIEKRAEMVKKMAQVLREGKEEYARLMTLEMGKPITQARSEVEKCAWACEVAAEKGVEWLKEEVVIGHNAPQPPLNLRGGAGGVTPSDPQRAYVRFEPLGVILAIMPWNFPFWQFFRFGAGALVAGNAIVLKHASNVPQCALAIEEIWKNACFHALKHESKELEMVVQTLLVGSGSSTVQNAPQPPLNLRGGAIDRLIDDPRIAAVTLTGSTTAGRKVAEAAGHNIKKIVLELGGSDPFIVLADADVPATCQAAAQARTLNSGQSCIAAKRFIVVRKVAEEFTQQFVEKMKALVVGDPMDEKTQVGPLARRDLVDELDRQVRESVAKGAKLLCGGAKITLRRNSHDRENYAASTRPPLDLLLIKGEKEGVGFFYMPTVLAEVKPGMPAYDEELFGPVASVIVAQDEEDAVRIANDSVYGLGAAIWTRDIAKAERMAAQLECGAVFINDFVKSDPRLPFGGVKQSGYGRELGVYGIKEFVNVKTVVVK